MGSSYSSRILKSKLSRPAGRNMLTCLVVDLMRRGAIIGPIRLSWSRGIGQSVTWCFEARILSASKPESCSQVSVTWSLQSNEGANWGNHWANKTVVVTWHRSISHVMLRSPNPQCFEARILEPSRQLTLNLQKII